MKTERTIPGTLSAFLPYFHDRIMRSLTATAEDGTDLTLGDVRTSLRVYERYSLFGSNRVSLTLSVAEYQGSLRVCVITSGGSEGTFLKLLPVGEATWADAAASILDAWAEQNTGSR